MTKDLIIFEMANNHQGDMDHAKKIIDQLAKISKEYKLNSCVKFQYRDLDTFVHPSVKGNLDIHYVKRFESTRLSFEQFEELIKYCKANKIQSMVTPFDEASVPKAVSHGVDFLKVASASADDWSLLESIVDAGLPVVASTGGLSVLEVDRLYSFFKHKGCDYALMHCVGIYPTPPEKLNLSMIQKYNRRYYDIPVGYSGHESPDDTDTVRVAYGLGARFFERHIGMEDAKKDITLNAYSMNMDQTRAWVEAYLKSKEITGDELAPRDVDEVQTLNKLRRGAFVSKSIKEGSEIKDEQVYFAFPKEDGQMTSGEFSRYRNAMKASKTYSKDEALYETLNLDEYHYVRDHINTAICDLNEIGVDASEATIELSHHYGIERFQEVGCIIFNFINREYCKKLIYVLAGQTHPEQYHVKKEETFHVLKGHLDLKLNGTLHKLERGNIVTIERGIRHEFSSTTGCIFEEVSTTHSRGDSFYLDPIIDQQDPMKRKSMLQ